MALKIKSIIISAGILIISLYLPGQVSRNIFRPTEILDVGDNHIALVAWKNNDLLYYFSGNSLKKKGLYSVNLENDKETYFADAEINRQDYFLEPQDLRKRLKDENYKSFWGIYYHENFVRGYYLEIKNIIKDSWLHTVIYLNKPTGGRKKVLDKTYYHDANESPVPDDVHKIFFGKIPEQEQAFIIMEEIYKYRDKPKDQPLVESKPFVVGAHLTKNMKTKWEQYYDHENGFTINFPSNWYDNQECRSLLSDPKGIVFARYFDEGYDDMCPCVSLCLGITVRIYDTKDPSDAWLNQLIELNKQYHLGSFELKSQIVTRDGQQMEKFTIMKPGAEANTAIFNVLRFSKNNKYYEVRTNMFTNQVPKKSDEVKIKILEDVMNSFRLVENDNVNGGRP